MFDSVWIAWLLTIGFAVLVLCSLWLIFAAHSRITLLSHLFHALMSLAMILMAWPGPHHATFVWQGLFFALAALWFVVVVIASKNNWYWLADTIHPSWYNSYHAIMMAAMAWMLIAMTPWVLSGSMGPMGHAHIMHGGPTWASRISLLCLLAMLAGAAVFLVESFYHLRTKSVAYSCNIMEPLSIAGMSAGMAIMFIPMAL